MKEFIENRKILYVDDEPELLNSFKSLLRKEKYDIITLQDSKKINEVLEENGPFAVVFSDQRMPDYDGVHILKSVAVSSPETIRILITGFADYNDTIRAINQGGLTSYVSKPWDDELLRKQVKDWVGQYNLKEHNKYLLRLLDEENRNLAELLDGTVAQTIRILGDFANQVSPLVTEFGIRVKTVGTAFLKVFHNLTPDERWEINRAFDLLNLGFALLPTAVQHAIAKEGLAIIENVKVASNHHVLAAGMIKDIPRFGNVARIIELYKKDYSGGGEPKNVIISGADIPFGARLLRIIVDFINAPAGSKGSDVLHRMKQMPSKYDVGLIKSILDNNLETDYISEDKKLPVTALETGMVILKEVRTISGQLLLKPNIILTDTYINILNQWHARDPIQEPVAVRCSN